MRQTNVRYSALRFVLNGLLQLGIVGAALWSTGAPAFPANCDVIRNSQFETARSLYTEIALIGPDNRTTRSPADFGAQVEAAQGRVLCLLPGKKKPKAGQRFTEEFILSNYYVGNATLMFEDDLALINRHMFMENDGKPKWDWRNCKIQHVSSGEIIDVIDVEYPPAPISGKAIEARHSDIALVRLSKAPQGGAFLTRDQVMIKPPKDVGTPLKLVSNMTADSKKGTKFGLTKTNCSVLVWYASPNLGPTNVTGTDCDGADGTSGSLAYASDNGTPKVFGMYSSSFQKVPNGGEFDAKNLSSLVITFDEKLIETYEKIKDRRGA